MKPEEVNIENIQSMSHYEQTLAKRTHKTWMKEQRLKDQKEMEETQ